MKRPVSRLIEGIFIFFAILIPFSFALFFLIYFFTHNSESDVSPVDTNQYLYLPYLNSGAMEIVFHVSLVFPICLIALFFLLSILFILKQDIRIFVFQWRAL